jgi:hypothetical protein
MLPLACEVQAEQTSSLHASRVSSKPVLDGASLTMRRLQEIARDSV